MGVVWYTNQYVIEGSPEEASREIAAIVLASSRLELGVRIENVWVPDDEEDGSQSLQWVVTRDDGGHVPEYAEWSGAHDDSAE